MTWHTKLACITTIGKTVSQGGTHFALNI